jgi:hypothetical protein
MSKIQEALNLNMGNNLPAKPRNLGATAEGFDLEESSARIEHVDVDGSLEIEVETDLG